jgi:hypothetical protein
MFRAALFITAITAITTIPALMIATIDILLGPPVLLITIVLFHSCFLRVDNERHYLEHHE